MDVVRENNEFTRNLALIAVDECHCAANWEEFRPLFDQIGKLQLLFMNVSFACLSMTLMPYVADWIHDACKLKWPTINFTLSTRRDDINLAVIPIDDLDNLEPLLNLITLRNDDKSIPKMLIFVDSVDRAAHIILQMKYALVLSRGSMDVINDI